LIRIIGTKTTETSETTESENKRENDESSGGKRIRALKRLIGSDR
jgi:hypothetical protein